MMRELLENFKIISIEIIGLVGGLLWSMATKFNEHEPLVLMACSGFGLLISVTLRFFPKEDKEEIKLLNIKDSFLFEFKELIKAVKEQSDIFISKSEELKDFTKQEFGIEIISNLKDSNARISKYNQQDLQVIFPNKLKHILNVFENFRNVELQIARSEKDLNSSIKKINKNIVQNKADINKIEALIQKFASSTNGKIDPRDEFLFNVGILYNQHTLIRSNYQILWGKESLVNPIKLILNKFSTDVRAIELSELIQMCDFRYREIENEMNFLIESFNKLGSDLLETSNNIDREINKLN